MQTSLDLHRYLAETDPLAQRYLQILTAFYEAIKTDSVTRVASSSLRDTNQTIFFNFFGERTRAASIDVRSHTSPMKSMDYGNARPPQDGRPFHTGATPKAANGQPSGSVDAFQMSPNMSTTDISPPDYSLDFDNFLSLVSQDPPYQVDGTVPMYGTTNLLPNDVH